MDQLENTLGSPPRFPLGVYAWIAACIVLAAVAAFFLLYKPGNSTQGGSAIKEINSLAAKGEYGDAVKTYREFISRPDTSADARAQATLNASGLLYLTTATTTDLIPDIRALKSYIENPSVSDEMRALLVARLAALFNVSGRNKGEIFNEIYSGEYARYAIGSDKKPLRHQTSRGLLLWSYELNPTANVAGQLGITVIRDQLIKPYLPKDEQSTVTLEESVASAERYLADAERLAGIESAGRDSYTKSSQYLNLEQSRAYILGGLAFLVGGDYKQEYRDTYESLLDSLQNSENFSVKSHIPFVRFQYARFLHIVDKDDDRARAQLHELVQFMKNSPRSQYIEFKGYLNRLRAGPSFAFAMLTELSAISPKFKAYADSLRRVR